MSKILLAFLLLCATAAMSPVSAQECPSFNKKVANGRDAAYIRSLFQRAVIRIGRLNQLAVMANELKAEPRSQRAALDAEFQIWVRFITQLGAQPHPVRASSAEFIDEVLDSTFLGLDGAGVDGSTVAEAEAKSYEAVRKTVGALSKLWKCYSGPLPYPVEIVTPSLFY